MSKSDCGRLGGLQTSLTHNHNFYQSIGHAGGIKGGRPRRLTLAEIRAKLQAAPEAKITNFKEVNCLADFSRKLGSPGPNSELSLETG